MFAKRPPFVPTPVFQSAASNSDTVGTLTISRPSTYSTGNLFIAMVYADTGITSISTPSGWTKQLTTQSGTSGLLTIYTKTATGSEPTTYSFTVVGSFPYSAGVIAAFSSAALDVFGTPGSGSIGSSSSLTIPEVSATQNKSLQLAFIGSRTASVSSTCTSTSPASTKLGGTASTGPNAFLFARTVQAGLNGTTVTSIIGSGSLPTSGIHIILKGI